MCVWVWVCGCVQVFPLREHFFDNLLFSSKDSCQFYVLLNNIFVLILIFK